MLTANMKMIAECADKLVHLGEKLFNETEMGKMKIGQAAEFSCPDGYEFKDEHGNVIEAKKIVLEKKTPKYPQSYEECCKVMKCDPWFEMNTCYHGNELSHLYRLLICRDAYWKLAGDWKPDWNNGELKKHCIYNDMGAISRGSWFFCNAILSFPTEEMRDAFYENFKDLIEECKELL